MITCNPQVQIVRAYVRVAAPGMSIANPRGKTGPSENQGAGQKW